MPVKAMRVETRKKHPNADTLWVYDLAVGDSKLVQVVANSDHIYEEGELVAVALPGAILRDGTEVKKAKFRGLASYGMILNKADHEEGADLTEFFCHDDYSPKTKPRHVKWPAIELLHNVLRNLQGIAEHVGAEYKPPVVSYCAKVKLHGTNAAIQIAGGRITAQSRKCILTPEVKDNKGFRAWVEKNRDYWEQYLGAPKPLTFFGEWCGPGVQRGMAVSKLDRKIFVVFGVQVGFDHEAEMVTEPGVIETLCSQPHPDVFILPWYSSYVEIDFGSSESLEKNARFMAGCVRRVEAEDTWVKETFGISGVGEGLVWYPVSCGNGDPLPWYLPAHELMFKTKGEKHSVVQQKAPVQIAPEVAESIEGFVEMFVTEARCEQILGEVFGDEAPTKRGTGLFLKAFNADVIKESEAELEVAGLEWKQVAKGIAEAARKWLFTKV